MAKIGLMGNWGLRNMTGEVRLSVELMGTWGYDFVVLNGPDKIVAIMTFFTHPDDQSGTFAESLLGI